ncbi:fibronectin type III domain-containing protein [Chryseobacterium sp. CFBP8996]|uniref:fibronectin type III domain-containing protein n=1 Tax=Chryseobacterium sp. CFBP8996 TaxID=3096529 RepID=UPI002A6AAE9E|nr:fibronectin type III domain-containing protein [Chryseobacterium sp. CFBP8996]MDY0932243.1 fibronectin type III domain-containing protein [Chryseobacterium sp. CFBP8996]
MKKFLFSCLLFIVTCINAQINLGVGSTTTGIAPISTYYGYSYVQQIFPKTEINAAAAGNITGVKFYLSPSSVLTNSSSWTVYLGHTNKATFDSNTDWIAVTGLTQVFTGTVTNTAGVVEITFPTPFAYNNVDNLVIAARENSPNYDSNGFADAMYVYNTAANRSIYYRSDTTIPNPASPPTAGGRNGYNSATTLLGLAPSPIPACPTVTAPAAAATGVSLTPAFTWNSVSGATGYRLSVGTTSGGTNIVNNQDLGNVTTYTLPVAAGLQYSTQYYYTISSYSATNPSATCSVRNFTTQTIPCPAVSAPAAGAVGVSTTPTITWAAVTGATGYRLTVGTTAGGTQTLNNVDLGNVTSYTFPTPLANNTQYYYKVNSYNTGGASASCTERNFRTLCTTTPLPWTENFDAMSTLGAGIVPPCWAQVTGSNAWTSSNAAASNSSPGPRSTQNYVRVQYGNSTASQLWTPGFTLTAGTTYEFSFYYHTGGTDTSNIGFTGNVLVNSSQSSTGATNLGTFITATQGTANYTQYKVYYTPATTGNYNFAVNASSTFAPWYLGVDDFRVRVAPTCIEPLGVVAVSATGNTATVSWNPPTTQPANGYQIYYSTTTTPPGAPQVPFVAGTATNYTIPGLNPSTTYYIWIKAICSGTDQSDLSDVVSIMTTQIPATLPYTQNFTTGNDLGLLNGTQANKWVRGNVTGNPAQSLYISNDNGVTNGYAHTTSTVHAFRDIQIPIGTTLASFSFDWKGQGEGTTYKYDYLEVWLVPSTYLPAPGTLITAGAGRVSLGQYNLQGTWQSYSNSNLNLTNFANSVMRLVFQWRNDGGGGTQPSIAIDNIVLRVCSNATPVVTVVPASITHNAANLTWPQDIGGASYVIRYRPLGTGSAWLPSTGPITVAAVTTATNGYPFPQNLLPFTDYEVEVAAVCNNVPGVFSHNEFKTKCDPTPPNVTVTSITPTSALVTWNPLAAGATYELQWKLVSDPATAWQSPPLPGTPQPPLNSYTITGLSSYKTYEVQVRNKCIGSATFNPWSTSQVFTTVRVCEIPPPGLTITQLNPTSAEVVWDAYTGPGATNNYILKYRKVGLPGWTTINVSNNTYTITGLLELTKYEMQVANVCTGTPGNFTPEYYFTTPTVVYCPMHSTNFGSEFISKVTAKPAGKPDMINITAGSAYSDYTTVPAKFIDMVQGSVGNQIIVDKTISSGAKAGVAVWIDFNRNGTFDLDERILADGPNTNPTASATFTVPSNAFLGSTNKYVVMRVAMSKDAIPVSCVSFTDGEVEDYTVRISQLPTANAVNQTDILIYPNPVKSILNVKNISKKAKYNIYSAAGQLVSSGVILNNKIDVSRLINGLYVIDIDDVQGTAQRKFIKE